jgi:putative photosynthetic complex assembly protein
MSAQLIPTAQSTIPKGLLVMIGCTLLATLVAVAAVRMSGINIREPDAPSVQVRELRFEDKPNGNVAVIDALTNKEVQTISGEAGFVRSALRGLARERKRVGVGAEKPFELIARSDGRLTLRDPVTDRRIDLESFGAENAANFAQMLSETAKKQPQS